MSHMFEKRPLAFFTLAELYSIYDDCFDILTDEEYASISREIFIREGKGEYLA